MNIFSRIFRKAKPPEGETERAEILGGGNSFSAWNGDAYANDIYRGAVDAIARNVGRVWEWLDELITRAEHATNAD